MSHRITVTLPDDLWGRFDRLREHALNNVSEPEAIRVLVTDACDTLESYVTGRSQMALLHPAVAPAPEGGTSG